MAHTHSTVSVKLLDKEYCIACPPGSEDELMAAARALDHQMRKLRANQNMSMERVAIMAALNATYKLNHKPTPAELSDNALTKLDALNERCLAALADEHFDWCATEENAL